MSTRAGVKYLLIPDLHLPWTDWAKVREVERFADAENPEQIIFLGDVIDAYLVSRFTKTALDSVTAKTIRREREGVDRLRALFFSPTRKKPIWLCGNHEARIASRLGESAFLGHYTGDPMRQWAAGFDYRASGEMNLGGVYVCHGHKSQKVAGTAAASMVYGKSVVQGHSHKLALIWCTGGKYAIEAGYLAKPDAPCFTYAPGLQHGMKDWATGFAWIGHDGSPHIEKL